MCDFKVTNIKRHGKKVACVKTHWKKIGGIKTHGYPKTVGNIPMDLVGANVAQMCTDEWDTRMLRWALQPLTGINAPEHTLRCEIISGSVCAIIVSHRVDPMRPVFKIRTTGNDAGLVCTVYADI